VVRFKNLPTNQLKSNVAPLPKKVRDNLNKAVKAFPKPKKQLSHKGLVRKLDTLFSKFIRQRDWFPNWSASGERICQCCTCGAIKEDANSQVHAGHFQKRGNWNTRWDEMNVHAQCKKCNTFQGGRDFEFGLYIDKKYGPGTAEKLYIKAKMPRKWMRVELEEMIKVYKEKLND